MSRKLRIGIVGSGPTGAAAAWALRHSGHKVEMLDFGNEPEPAAKELAMRLRQKPFAFTDLSLLKAGFDRPVGPRPGQVSEVEQVVRNVFGRQSPADLNVKKLFGSAFTFKDTKQYIPVNYRDYQVPRSLAKGGLSNVWGAACYPFTESDLSGWPIAATDLAPHYRAVSDILGLSEKKDRLAEYFPIYSKDSEALVLNPQAQSLLRHWESNFARMNEAGFRFGQARLAVLTKDRDQRRACDYKGLCLTGCPNDSIYSSAFTVDELRHFPDFTYRPGFFVHSFEENSTGQVMVNVASTNGKRIESLTYDKLLVGAGTLSTLRLVHQSLRNGFERVRLLDNTMFLLPLLKRTRRLKFQPEVPFTLSQLVLLLDNPAISSSRLHTQLYSYSDYVFDRFQPALRLMPRAVQLQLLNILYNTFIMFIYLPGEHSTRIEAELSEESDEPSKINLKCTDNPQARETIRRLRRHLLRNRAAIDLFPISVAIKSTPPGFSGHLAGSFPMSKKPSELQTHDNGLLHGFRSVHLLDASTFPSLPAQNCTYTAMANAHRMASQLI